ncbi:MAG: hypothetical protein HPY69_09930 [Armatimonadetes bacterium]|nr:hypothetical protein [Armatimonadota bacterium]
MKGHRCAIAATLVSAVVLAIATHVDAEDWGPAPIVLETAFTEAQPPRALLDQTVSVTLTGTVAQVVRALAEGAGRDWVVSAPSDDFGPEKEFQVEGLALWQAMDKLLGVYGYDWGVHARVVIAWPATQPARERPDQPAPEEETWVDTEPRESLVLDTPTALTDLLKPLSEPWDGEAQAEYAYVAPELRSWRLVGRIAALDRLNGASIPLAVGAVTEYAGGAMALEYGTHRRLDDAWKCRASSPDEPGGPPEETWPKMRLRKAVLGALTAQQWVYLRNLGEVQIAFRELSVEAAALFLAAAEKAPRLQTGGRAVDWHQPQRLFVSIRVGEITQRQDDGTELKFPTLQVGCNVPLTDDTMWRF